MELDRTVGGMRARTKSRKAARYFAGVLIVDGGGKDTLGGGLAAITFYRLEAFAGIGRP